MTRRVCPGAAAGLERQACLQQGQAALEPVGESVQVSWLVEPGGHGHADHGAGQDLDVEVAGGLPGPLGRCLGDDPCGPCLLYTSDAADE